MYWFTLIIEEADAGEYCRLAWADSEFQANCSNRDPKTSK